MKVANVSSIISQKLLMQAVRIINLKGWLVKIIQNNYDSKFFEERLWKRLNHRTSKLRLGWKVEKASHQWMHSTSLAHSDLGRGFLIWRMTTEWISRPKWLRWTERDLRGILLRKMRIGYWKEPAIFSKINLELWKIWTIFVA